MINSTGEYHAGWFDESGTFFNVTEALNMQSKSDLDEPFKYTATGFSNNGYFVTGGDSRLSVPVDNVTLEAALQNTDVIYDALPSLHGDYVLTDWINETSCLVDVEGEEWDERINSVINDVTTEEITEYIPGDSRYNWNGVLSPDETQVAFLSTPKEGTAKPTLFIVPLGGGDPISAGTSLEFTYRSSPNSPDYMQYPTYGDSLTVFYNVDGQCILNTNLEVVREYDFGALMNYSSDTLLYIEDLESGVYKPGVFEYYDYWGNHICSVTDYPDFPARPAKKISPSF